MVDHRGEHRSPCRARALAAGDERTVDPAGVPSVAATSARCDLEQMFLRDAIESAANKRFGDALSSYEAIMS